MDYIPCIAWEENAIAINKMKVMDEIYVSGRVQSRTYFKSSPSGDAGEFKTAYEVSASIVSSI